MGKDVWTVESTNGARIIWHCPNAHICFPFYFFFYFFYSVGLINRYALIATSEKVPTTNGARDCVTHWPRIWNTTRLGNRAEDVRRHGLCSLPYSIRFILLLFFIRHNRHIFVWNRRNDVNEWNLYRLVNCRWFHLLTNDTFIEVHVIMWNYWWQIINCPYILY